jgi:hypothetical protein
MRQSRVIHDGKFYSACDMASGDLIIQSKRGHSGQRMIGSHPYRLEWIEAIETAIDAKEREELCRAFINQ